MTPLEELGGKEKLLEIIQYFYKNVVVDPMIGFMFKNVELSKLIEREFEFNAVILGDKNTTYKGRGMRRAHNPHRIMGGQFERRQQLLREALSTCHAPASVSALWLAHNESLRPQITSDPARHCASTPQNIDPFNNQRTLFEDAFFKNNKEVKG